MLIKILPNENGPSGKLADAELHFTDGPLAGLKLLGFAVWERRSGPGRNVTFPARTYSVAGERRSFSLLRPAAGDLTAQEPLRALILAAYDETQQPAEQAAEQPGDGFRPHEPEQPARDYKAAAANDQDAMTLSSHAPRSTEPGNLLDAF